MSAPDDVIGRIPEVRDDEWRLIWHGNEAYPFPLSIVSADGERWIARDGTVSSEAAARLLTAAPKMATALRTQAAEIERLRAALEPFVDAAAHISEYANDGVIIFAGLTLGDIRRAARAARALAPTGEPT